MKKALICESFGAPDTLTFQEVPTPVPGKDEVVVEVCASALNFPDTLTIRGQYQIRPELPFSPGAEMSGIVKEVGLGVREFQPGDRVFAGTIWGAMREEMLVSTRNMHLMPESMDFITASSLAVTYGTALHALLDRAAAKAGEHIAILGASGGLGVALIQVAKALGLRVIACASTQEKLDYCRNLGADACVNYREEDLKLALKSLTDGRGVDVVCDPVGGAYTEAALRATAWGGRLMVLGFTSGEIAKIPVNLPLLKGNCVCGVFWSAFVKQFPEKNKKNFEQLIRWWEEGLMAPSIQKVFPFERALEAFAMMERRQVMGKLVLDMQGDTKV